VANCPYLFVGKINMGKANSAVKKKVQNALKFTSAVVPFIFSYPDLPHVSGSAAARLLRLSCQRSR
jgi:hypothetical protein